MFRAPPVGFSSPWVKSRTTPASRGKLMLGDRGEPGAVFIFSGSVCTISASTLKPVVSTLATLLAITSISCWSTIWRDKPT